MSVHSEFTISGGTPLRGHVRVPGDKGISHRALVIAAMADGESTITGLARGRDVAATRAALTELGVDVRDADRDGSCAVRAKGIDALREPETVVDCENSGTTLRMLAGLVAGRPFLTILTGDASLLRRPMRRITDPLRTLGAHVDGRADGAYPPLVVRGGDLHGADISLAVASGQVKTALALAGMQAHGTTTIREPAPSRDHTERMLTALGVDLRRIDERTIEVRADAPTPFDLDVPGDPSSAAFLIAAAAIVPDSNLVIEDLLLNPGRLGFVDVLRRMGARITVRERGERLGEPVGDVEVESAPLTGTVVECAEPFVDEIPAIAVAAAFADGPTEIHNLAELRVKESDRVATVLDLLDRLGVSTESLPDGLVVQGGSPRAATFESHGDHRLALAAATAAVATPGRSVIRGWDAVGVSYPEYADDLAHLRGTSERDR